MSVTNLYEFKHRLIHNPQTATSMTWFMLAMIAHPEKQRKCQEELDRVVGRSRMPTFDDKPNLPYLRAAVRELLRWRPVVPLGEPCQKLCLFYSCSVNFALGVQHSTTEVSSFRLSTVWDPDITHYRMIGTKATSFPKAPSV